jgi:hypothetical protein
MDFGDLSPENTISGGTNGTLIGNTGDSLKVYAIGEIGIDPAANSVVITNAVTIVDPSVPASATDTLTALNDTVVKANTVGVPVITWAVTGTFSATHVFEASNDNSNWFAIEAYNCNGWQTVTSITAAGLYLTDVPAKYIRIRTSVYTSGTATVVYQANNSETPFVRARLSQSSGAAGVSSTDRIVTIETDHQWIHQGLTFSCYQVFTGLNNGQVTRISFLTGAVTEHLIFAIFADFQFRFKMYEGSVVTETTTLTEFNRNRSSANTSNCVIKTVTAVTSAGTLLPDILTGSTGGSASSIIIPRGDEIILAANTRYMFEITSLQNSNDVSLNLTHYRTAV